MAENTTNSDLFSDSSDFSGVPTEKDFIREFSRIFQLKNKPLLSGSEFDDCAAIRLSAFCRDLSSESLTFSTDTVRESTDFPAGMTMWQKGWMAAAVNLSDLAAMGSSPVAFLFSAGLPRGFTLEDTAQLAQGIQDCVSFFGAEVIGGDTEYAEELTITGTVIGLSENKQLLLRKNAQPGDLLCLTGFAGSAGIALKLLLNQISSDSDPNDSNSDSNRSNSGSGSNRSNSVSDSFLKNLTEPFPRIFEGKMLAKSCAVHSMIDTSDGLASSIYELSTLSGVFFEIDEQNLPLDGEALEIISSYLKNENDVDNQEQNEKRTQEQNQEQEQKQNQGRICEKAYAALVNEALYTGGDFELLFTISPDKLSLIEDQFSHFNQNFADRFNILPSSGKSGRFPCKFTVIGKAIAEKENVILRHTGYGQKRQPLLKIGYDSFTKLYMI